MSPERGEHKYHFHTWYWIFSCDSYIKLASEKSWQDVLNALNPVLIFKNTGWAFLVLNISHLSNKLCCSGHWVQMGSSWADSFQRAVWSFTDPCPFILKQARYVKGISECIPCVRKLARGFGSVYGTARCDKLRIMRPAFIWTHRNQTQTSQVSHTSHGSKQSGLFLFFLLLSPFLSFCLTFIHF